MRTCEHENINTSLVRDVRKLVSSANKLVSSANKLVLSANKLVASANKLVATIGTRNLLSGARMFFGGTRTRNLFGGARIFVGGTRIRLCSVPCFGHIVPDMVCGRCIAHREGCHVSIRHWSNITEVGGGFMRNAVCPLNRGRIPSEYHGRRSYGNPTPYSGSNRASYCFVSLP